MRVAIKAALISAITAAVISGIGIIVNSSMMKQSIEKAEKAYQLSKEVFEIQNTPRLSAQIFGESYVGPMEGRIDEVVTTPIAVFNNSDAFAHKVTLDLLIADGTGREVSLNEYFRSVNAPIMYKERLSPREQWLILPPKAMSSPGNSKELYATGKLNFKAKLQLTWTDAKGNEYKFVNLEKLKYVRVEDETVVEGFWFDSIKTYNSIDNKEDLERNWGLNFNY